MKIIKLDAIDSTNSYLKGLLKNDDVETLTFVIAKNQTKGKGQHSTNWVTEPYKNLTFSVLIKESTTFNHQKYLSFCVALAVIKCLENFNISHLKIKWPNDILAENNKICGILIENMIRNNGIYASIIGIGLNVNQTDFNGNLMNATSMKKIKNKDFNLDICLEIMVAKLLNFLELFKNQKFDEIEKMYYQYLYKLNENVVYKDAKNQILNGIIRKVGENGELIIENEQGLFLQYQVKEIKFKI